MTEEHLVQRGSVQVFDRGAYWNAAEHLLAVQSSTRAAKKVLVIGSGGREHAICRALRASPSVEELFCAPGSDAISREAIVVPIAVHDVEGIVRWCRAWRIDLVVPGPELPLILGLADRLEEEGIEVFGPGIAASQLEGSKAFAKNFCSRWGIPTAEYRTFRRDRRHAAQGYIRSFGAPVVIKADGLAAGKGVTVADTVGEALSALDAAFEFGDTVVVEDRLYGREVSLFVAVSGGDFRVIGTATDYKAAFKGGPNTGGMGACSPAPDFTLAELERALNDIVRPTAAGMAAEGRPYRGILYVGLMLTETGPKLVEFNVRLGDPEAQVLVPRIRSDLFRLFSGELYRPLVIDPRPMLTVVMASEGYPGQYLTGSEIRGLERAEAVEGVTVFHAGTYIEDGMVFSGGGRVLNVTARGDTLAEARERAYAAVDLIDWPGGFCRRDIGEIG